MTLILAALACSPIESASAADVEVPIGWRDVACVAEYTTDDAGGEHFAGFVATISAPAPVVVWLGAPGGVSWTLMPSGASEVMIFDGALHVDAGDVSESWSCRVFVAE